MRLEEIQDAAKWLHSELWKHKEKLWPDWQPAPIQMLEPEIAAAILGLQYLELPNLGSTRFCPEGQRFKAAGMLDRQGMRVGVSMEFSREIIRFTAAHELGHYMLHDGIVMHRDKPLDGSQPNAPKPVHEREADKFAACFLMPPKLLRHAFEEQFQTKGPLRLNDLVCYHLDPADPNSLLEAEEGSLVREIAVARCSRFNGRALVPLATQFGVSVSAMAIRLKELELLIWP